MSMSSDDVLTATVNSQVTSRQTKKAYKLDKLLGEGSFGQVWACKSGQKELALKLVKPSDAEELMPEVRIHERASRAAEASVPKFHEASEAVLSDPSGRASTDIYVIVMDRIDGTSLKEVAETMEVKLDAARPVLFDLILACKRLHAAGIVHSDIKPENILMSRQGFAYICDFGVSHALDNGGSDMLVIGGTPVYMAPEMLEIRRRSPEGRAMAAYGKPADIWALGISVIHMLLGEHHFAACPLHNINFEAVFHYIKTKKGPQIAEAEGTQIGQFLEACLERGPRRRATADKLFARNQELLAHTTAHRDLLSRVVVAAIRASRSLNAMAA